MTTIERKKTKETCFFGREDDEMNLFSRPREEKEKKKKLGARRGV